MLMLLLCAFARAQYGVTYLFADSATIVKKPSLQSSFPAQGEATDYIRSLPALLQTKGFLSASVDSVRYDSLSARAIIFLGQQYSWAVLRTAERDKDLLEAVRWNGARLSNTSLDFSRLQSLQSSMLSHLQETGYPFARIFLDSIDIRGSEVAALLKVERGPLYKIDSIRVYGDAKVSNTLLQRYLDIPEGSLYDKRKLLAVDGKLAQLIYLESERPSDLTLLGTGSVLNLYLKAKKNNQVNALIGFLPNPDAAASKKLQIAGEANILLRNALGGGETLGLNWQQLQQSSPRLTLVYEQPYFLRSPVGLGVNFEMLRKDTTFLNLLFNLSGNYRIGKQVASVYLQRRQTIVNGVNAEQVRFTRQLPAEGDVASNNLGVSYEYNSTDYRFNPRKGNEFFVTTSAGTKKIKKNSQVLALKDPSNPSFKYESLYDTVKLKTYQFRVQASGAHYFPVGRQSTIRTAINAGWYQSGNIFRNELFQIGGYKLLRGFDEESQYVSQYALGTVEYRILLTQNSNFFVFGDGGWAKHPLAGKDYTYLSTGLGISFETKAGIFNLAVALGKRSDVDFNLRQSKVHLGFVSYF
ncbi:MAG: hypothetical protein JWP69_1367 [Flaviaesturariibacter sp.]|nr:hypothetical protein [Flaviaesturariibacter sp.]